MHEPPASAPLQTAVAFARVSAALDDVSSVIAGFALLAGARAFMFIALLGWREPVLGGAGLVLLAVVGWLRWRCGGVVLGAAAGSVSVSAAAVAACEIRSTTSRNSAAVAAGHPSPGRAYAHDRACYNRTSPCEANWRAAAPPFARTQCAIHQPARHAVDRDQLDKETPC